MTDFRRIPPLVREGMALYLDNRIQPGHFLSAVFANDLFNAIGHADDQCLAALPSIISFIYMETPGTCHGSWEKVNAWLGKVE